MCMSALSPVLLSVSLICYENRRVEREREKERENERKREVEIALGTENKSPSAEEVYL